MIFAKFPKRESNIYPIMILLIACIIFHVSAASAQTWYRQNGGSVTQTGQTWYSTLGDTCGVYVYNMGSYTLVNSHIWKTGNTSNVDSSSFYGRDAAILAKTGYITLSGDSITANGTGINGAFACYTGSSLLLNNDTISTTGDYSHGIEATVGATIVARNSMITTYGSIGASGIATDCGGGIISVYGGAVTTYQLQATGIYSTGTVTDSGTTFISFADNGFVIDGRNNLTLTDVTSTASLSAVKVYESAPGDASGTAQLTISGGTFTSSVYGIYIAGNNGTRAIVTINNGAVFDPSSGYIVYIDSGASLVFTADAETLTGNIFADSTAIAVDTLSTILQNNTSLSGTVTRSALSIDAASSWYVTGDSHITTFADATGVSTTSLSVSNITGNGYNVYYQESLPGNSWLGGKNYTLAGGGCLLPEGAACSPTAISVLTRITDDITIYPNPASGTAQVSYPASYEYKSMTIMSMDGSVVLNTTLQPGSTDIDVSSFGPGIYMLCVESGEGKRVIKFVKE